MPLTRDDFYKYLDLGWSVIPVYFNERQEKQTDGSFKTKIEKLPRVKWREFQSRIATKEDVEVWFAASPPEGIGLVTGEVSKIVVVDVDTSDAILELTASVVSKSGFSGGRHYFYRWNEELRNTVRIDGMPIDFRGDGGYVVLPPSTFGTHSYSFEKFEPDTISAMPENILAMLTKEHRKSTAEAILTGNQNDPFQEAHEGQRNDTAARVAGWIVSHCQPDAWLSMGWMMMMDWNNRKCFPPLPEYELRNTFNSIMGAEVRTIVKEENGEAVVIDVPQPISLKDVATSRIEERELEKLAPKTLYRDLDKFIGGWVPGHVIVFTGDTNVGKTTMCCNFACRISEQKKTVLYFSLEPENTIVDYLASVRKKKRFNQLSDADLLEDDPYIKVYGKEAISRVEDLVKVVDALPRFDVIIIDHIGYFTTTGNDMNQKQSNVMKTLNALAKAKQSAVIVIAHIRKRSNRKEKINEDDISGSASFKQDAAEVLILERLSETDEEGNIIYTDKGQINVRKTKSGGGQGSVPVTFVPGTALIQDPGDEFKEFIS